MKNQRLKDLMILGQLALFVGMTIKFLIETENISGNPEIIISHIYGALLVIAFLIVMVSTHDFIHGDLLAKKSDEKKGDKEYIYLLFVMAITGLLYVGEIAPELGVVWMWFCLFGAIGMIISYKEIKSIHGMVWAITIIAIIVGTKRWSFLQHSDENVRTFIVMGFVLTFLASYISKAWKIKRGKKRKKNKEQATLPSIGADLKKLSRNY